MPANCQQVNGKWYFRIAWEDVWDESTNNLIGWKGVASNGTRLFCDFDDEVSVESEKK